MIKENKPLKSILFVSRNKDNKHIPNFKERKYVRLTTKTAEELKKDFDYWAAKGPEDEFCRFYMKINKRDPIKTKKKLIEELIFNDNFDLVAAEAKIAGIANKKECAAERKWLFDFDDTEDKLQMDMLLLLVEALILENLLKNGVLLLSLKKTKCYV